MKIEISSSRIDEVYGSFFNSINELHQVLEKLDESSLVLNKKFESLLQDLQSKLKFINNKLNNFNV